MKPTITLFRPVNQAELDLIMAAGWEDFPPRLPEQPFFYPVMNEQYAREITEKWNVPDFGSGFVVAWDMDENYLSKYSVKTVGGSHHKELWVPAEELKEFNDHIIGKIRLIASFL